jgi:hypothetical protein
LSREDAIKHFGSDYQIVGLELCKNQPDGFEDGFAYRSLPRGEIDYIEYPSQGIAIHLDHHGQATEIYFLSQPIGLASEKDCKKEIAKLKKKKS